MSIPPAGWTRVLRVFCLGWGAFALGCPLAVMAVPIVEVSASSFWIGSGQSEFTNLTPLGSTSPNTAASSSSAVYAASNLQHAQSSAAAYFGVLGASAAFDQNGPSTYGQASAEAKWFDSFVINGGVGEGIFKMLVHLTGSTSGNGGAGFTMVGTPYQGVLAVSTNGDSTVDQTIEFAQHFIFGESFDVTARLTAGVDSGSPAFARPGTAFFGSTARVLSTVVIDGATGLELGESTVRSGSGVNYNNLGSFQFGTANVPEESSTLLLVVFATGAMAWVRRRMG